MGDTVNIPGLPGLDSVSLRALFSMCGLRSSCVTGEEDVTGLYE